MSLIDRLTAQLPLIGKKPQSIDYFFGLHIGLSTVIGLVWELGENKVEIIGQKTLSYSGTDDLMEKANLSLDQALGAFGVEPNKILLGVPDSWLEGEDLKEIYLKLLRGMMKEYELEPMAYVASSHSLVHFLQKNDGVPPTAILVGIDEQLSITLVRAGKIIGTRTVKKTDSLFEDIESGLLSFSDVESLPAKICLYSANLTVDKLNQIKDELTSHHWMQKLPFLHLPKIDLLDADILAKALVLAGAVEINPDINLKHSFNNQAMSFSSPSSLGKIAPTFNQPLDQEDEVIASGGPLVEETQLSQNLEAAYTGLVQEEQRGLNLVQRQFNQAVSKFRLSPGFKLPKFNLQSVRLLNAKALLVVGILTGLIVAYLLLVKATVTIFVEPKILTKDAEIIADPKIVTADIDKKLIPGFIVNTAVSGSAKGRATGTKQIGESAKGQVIIYNKTDAPKTFAAGTVLVGPSNLKFTLDSSVNVASQSAFDTGISFGKQTASVTASSIGPDSNLSAGTTLDIQGQANSNFSAKVDTALTGGTSKDVTVVTADDQNNLKSQLLDDLKKKAQDNLQSKLKDGKKIIPDALSVTDADYSFSKRVNDQATEFSLNADVSFKGTAYLDTDLKTIVAKLVETNVPDNFMLNLAETETQADVAKVEKDGRLVFKAVFKAKLLPKLDEGKLKSSIRGRAVSSVATQLKDLENVLGSEIRLTPPLPSPLARMPLLTKNINIVITPK